jgi:hypothetical protein
VVNPLSKLVLADHIPSGMHQIVAFSRRERDMDPPTSASVIVERLPGMNTLVGQW